MRREYRPMVAVLRGALLLYGGGRESDARRLEKLLHGNDVFEKALSEIVKKAFRLCDVHTARLEG